MCGIVGVLASNGIMPVDYDKIFSQLLVADILRGDDSTGVLSVVGKKRLLWQKCAYDGYSFSISAPFQKLLNKHKNNHRFLLGHNRAATTGTITEDSAHPFIFDKVAGVHNGTIYNFGKWDTEAGLCAYEVDSQQLYYLINKYGPDATLKECSGAWALVWVNLQDKTLNFLRNSQRPLWFAHTTTGAIYWASEREMLEWILVRNKVNVQRYEMLPEYTLVSYKINNTNSRTDIKDIGRPKIIGSYASSKNWGGNYYQNYSNVLKTIKLNGEIKSASKDMLPHKTTESSKNDKVQERWKWERPVDFTKSYTARITHTEKLNHQLILVGHVFVHSGVTPEKFIVYGGVAADFDKWNNRLLTVKLQYRNKIDKYYVTRLHEVGPYKPAKESHTDEPIKVRGDSSDRLVRGPGGLFIPVEEFCDSVAHGCMNCGDPIQVSEANDLFWSEDIIPQPICPHCVELWDVFSKNYERLTTEH